MHSHTAKQLALLLGAALVLRLAAGWWWQSRLPDRFAFGFGDSVSYWELARTIAEGQPYQYGSPDARVFRTPGYPFLLAPIFLVAGPNPPVVWGRVLGAVLGTVAVAGVWWLARRLFGGRAGWIAGSVAAVYPGAIFTSALVLSEAPFCPLLIAQLILWTLAWQTTSRRQAAALALAAGLVAGAATLVRPSWLLFTPGAAVLGLVLGRPRKRHLVLGAAMLAGLVAVMAPWWLRNARLTGHFVPTTLQVGASLYDGLNPLATGASNMKLLQQRESSQRWVEQYAEVQDSGPREYWLDRDLRREAVAWARSHPRRVVALAAVKFLRMWNVWPNEPSLSTWPARLAVLVSYLPVLILGILGAGRSIRQGWPHVLCWLPAAYFTLLHVVFVSSIRYRQPAMLGLIVLAAGVAANWRDGRKGMRDEG